MDSTRHGPNLALCDVRQTAADWVLSSWSASAEANRVATALGRFEVFCEAGFNAVDLDQITPTIAELFVTASSSDGRPPSVSLQHLRRLSIRLLFRIARSSGHLVGDPTIDLALPPRSTLQTRPLTDSEVLLCRGVSQWSLSDSRRSAAWALAEATARTSELPRLLVKDLDLDMQRVLVHGGKRVGERWGILTSWGVAQLESRLKVIGADPDTPLLYRGRDASGAGQVAAATALQDVLVRAGLAGEADVRASSVAAWAGRRVLDETGRIDAVALALGVRSLDRAARIIAFDWLEVADQ